MGQFNSPWSRIGKMFALANLSACIDVKRLSRVNRGFITTSFHVSAVGIADIGKIDENSHNHHNQKTSADIWTHRQKTSMKKLRRRAFYTLTLFLSIVVTHSIKPSQEEITLLLLHTTYEDTVKFVTLCFNTSITRV